MTIDRERLQLSFSRIHKWEKQEISKRRKAIYYDVPSTDAAQPNLVGLALSGGGIRSATFCLGFLQELQRLRVLRIFDYLSTVSGGGYVGGWWSAWLSRTEEAAREIDQSSYFQSSDIHHPLSLLTRINEGADQAANDLLKHFKKNRAGLGILKLLASGTVESDPRLAEMLAFQLNTYLDESSRESLSAHSSKPPKVPLDEQATIERINDLRWQKRIALEQAFPYELRDIFPPREKIEPDRSRDRYESDGSRCAWEDPVHHLRLFANYLTPRKGILSADTWRAVSVITRNLALTWLILLPLLIGVMLLGQAYFLLNPVSGVREAFLCVGGKCAANNLTLTLQAIAVPIGILLASSVVMGIAWLLCNRDNSSPMDWMVQTACIVALVVLLSSMVLAIPPLRSWFVGLFGLPDSLRLFFAGSWSGPIDPQVAPALLRLRLLVAWFATMLLSVLLLWNLGVNDASFPKTDKETLTSWKRDVRRGRFSRAQSVMLVTTSIVGSVLLLSWFTCFLTKDQTFKLSFKLPFAVVPILTAVGGSIFTALRATPIINGERATAGEPSWMTRLVFAATPPSVVAVLAVLAAWFSHWLLVTLFGQQSIYVLLKVAAVLAIGLCMALAVYEMEDVSWSRVIRVSLAPVLFLGVLMINVSWGGQALFYNLNTERRYLLAASALIAVVITGVVFRRLVPRGKWKWRMFRHLDFVQARLKATEKDQHAKAIRILNFGSAIGAFIVSSFLTLVGYSIGQVIYYNTQNSLPGKLFGAIVLSLVALAGGIIIFRLLVVRNSRSEGRSLISLRFFGDRGKRPELLWLTASICLTMPIVVLCFAHFLHWHGKQHTTPFWNQALIFFPLSVMMLLISMMILRSLVIQRQLRENQPILPWSDGVFEWLFARIPTIGENRRRAFQLLAFTAICFMSLIDSVVQGVRPPEFLSVMGPASMSWTVTGLAFFLSLPIFGVSIFQIPVSASLYPLSQSRVHNWRLVRSRIFLWILASICVFWALISGLLLPNWLSHMAEIPLNTGLTPILLPVASGCFLIVLFELYWGNRDNRRSLYLTAFAYLAVASIFLMNLAVADLQWHLVPGLLVAIFVWVGALGWMVDPNAVSMHQFYKGRLVRAYLGASNVRRRKLRNKEITETVAGDDLPLKSLLNCDRGGPYHLVNTTLNLVAGRDLATAQRSASSFVLSQRYCGSARTNYCATDEYMNGQLTLGTAVAASGAAVSPNMGAKKPTAALAMLMTLLNVRLGYWAPTPNREGWNSAQPRLWPYYLVREFLSQTNDLSNYCYLTDGGHFDNTGLYSLIERGCRYVVLVDCGADPKPPCFQDFGEAIRRCRIDFGTEIDINLETFIKGNGKTDEHCFVTGRILFSKEHFRSLGYTLDPTEDNVAMRTGTLVYFKPAVIGTVTADVRQYSIENSYFPQQPTTNQWFDEAQFESYRRLGQLCASSAFDIELVKQMRKSPQLLPDSIGKLFAELSKPVGVPPKPAGLLLAS